MTTVLFVDPTRELKIKACGEKENALCMGEEIQTPENHVPVLVWRESMNIFSGSTFLLAPSFMYLQRPVQRWKDMPIKEMNETKTSCSFIFWCTYLDFQGLLNKLLSWFCMTSLNVRLEVSFLGECILAEWADERPLPSVFLHVYLKSILLVERLPTYKASEGSFTSMDSKMPHQLARLAELLFTNIAHFFLALRPLPTSFIDVSNEVSWDVLFNFNPMSSEEVGDSVLFRAEDTITPGTDIHLKRNSLKTTIILTISMTRIMVWKVFRITSWSEIPKIVVFKKALKCKPD